MGWDEAMGVALGLAAQGPATGVNPRVGCVILAPDGHLIGQGFHLGAGTPHAEIAALESTPPNLLSGATAVVTLEPCNHWGHTGPCTEALIAAGIAQVVYGVADPGTHSGGGAARLREAGVTVVGGVLAKEITEFLGDWLIAARLGRPHITVKWASSLDGRAAAPDGTSRWITGEQSRTLVHRQRAACDAIVVGTGTVIADNPQLTARTANGELAAHQPVPVVVGMRDLPPDLALAQHPHPVISCHTHDLHAVVAQLRAHGFRRVYVEGGPRLASAFIRAGLVDEYAIFLAPTLIGGPALAITDIGVESIDQQHPLSILEIDQLGPDLYLRAVPAPQRIKEDTHVHGSH